MIEIKKCADKNILEQFGIEQADGIEVMAAKEGDEIFGIGAALVEGDSALLLKIETKEEYKMFNMDFGIAKSVLNMLDLQGVRYVFSDIDDQRLMTALGFKAQADIPEDAKRFTDTALYLCLDGYFTAHEC